MESQHSFGYPRPDLERENYIMLLGQWDFSHSCDGSVNFDRKITVPYPPESRLSGISQATKPEDTIVYRRFVDMKKEEGKRFILNFLAVDYECTVLVNGESAGHHRGGYLPFSYDITDFITEKETEIRVMVTDPTDTMEIPRGKQTLHPHQIWYGPVSGIWQPVWIDIVPEKHITRLMVTPRLETSEFEFLIATSDSSTGKAVLSFESQEKEVPVNRPFRLKVDSPRLWTPDEPNLYRFSVSYGGESVRSYTAMRAFGIGKDTNGKKRLLLNGKPFYHHGVLDQGYWEESLLTPPSDQAMYADIKLMKDMGFNMIRKHIKIESPRWYYYAAELGMLVWQDMVNGGGSYDFMTVTSPLFLGSHLDDTRHRKAFARNSREEMERWESMLEETVLHLYSQPAIAMWVIFNEGWGQFDSVRMREKLLRLDSTRTIDDTSGWQDQKKGDFLSRHIYFRPYRYRDDRYGRAVLLSEFGGYGLDLSGKGKKGMFSYKKIKTKEELMTAVEKLYERDVIPAIPKGLAASVYTQLSDVESEKNGLITYDRKEVKVDSARMKALSEKLKI